MGSASLADVLVTEAHRDVVDQLGYLKALQLPISTVAWYEVGGHTTVAKHVARVNANFTVDDK